MSVRLYAVADWTVVELAGELDIHGAPGLRAMLAAVGPFIVFDLGRLRFLDAQGLWLLEGCARAVVKEDGCARVASASPHLRKLFALTVPPELLPIYDSLGEALTTPVGLSSGGPRTGWN